MFELFKYRLDINNITSLTDLKFKLLEQKIIHNKYKNVIKDFTEEQLSNFLYTGCYEKDEFEGIGQLFLHLYNKDLKKLIKFILSLKSNNLSIIRLFLYALQNEDKYEGNFLTYIKMFKKLYEGKFKGLLFELGKNFEIDRIDILNLFINLL